MSLAGGKVKPDIKIDGIDISSLLLGTVEESFNKPWYYYQGTRLKAVRKGPWKLAVASQSLGMGIREKPEDIRSPNPRLYNLHSDIGETTNVADQNPDVVARLQKLIDVMRADIGDGKSGPGVRPCGVSPNPVMLYPSPPKGRRGKKKKK